MKKQASHVPIRCDECRTIHMVPAGRLGLESVCQRCGASLPTRGGTPPAPPPPAPPEPEELDPLVAAAMIGGELPVARSVRAPGGAAVTGAPGARAVPASVPASGGAAPGRPVARARRRRSRSGLWMLLASCVVLAISAALFWTALDRGKVVVLSLPAGGYALTCDEELDLRVKRAGETEADLGGSVELRCRYQVEGGGSGALPASASVRVLRHLQAPAGATVDEDLHRGALDGLLLHLTRVHQRFDVQAFADVTAPAVDATAVAVASRRFAEDPFVSVYVPEHRLESGRSWEISDTGQLAELAPQPPVGSELEVTGGAATLTVAGFVSRAGQDLCEVTADISLRCRLTLGEQSFELRAVGSGRAQLDIEHGVVADRIEELEITGDERDPESGDLRRTLRGRWTLRWQGEVQ